ncbi:hypothetical protein AKJ09_03158 [Labilithrix luteola]|uniref:Integral membrane protein n=1 Tax=Labilithrix luteola TaxID=1391654 RepID=A0A0K1PTN4_9BACT|nr:hypothetical protein [Labilithrix luteola]AKU96494.1 hypothetical protein AKJ09_03158 [Labilithrix luteola]
MKAIATVSFVCAFACATSVSIRSASADDVGGAPEQSRTPATEAPAAEPAARVDPLVHVRFELGGDLPYVEQLNGGVWAFVCRAPCDQPLPSTGIYRVRGRKGSPSEPFRLPSSDSRVRVDARVATPLADVLGTTFIALGTVAGVAGAGVAAWPWDHRPPAALGAGIGMAVAGALFVAFGIFMWRYSDSEAVVTSERAEVSADSKRRQPRTSTTGVKWTGTGFVF